MGRGHRIRIWSKFPALLWLQKGGATPAGPLPPPRATGCRQEQAPGSAHRGGESAPRPAVLPQLRARRVHEPQRRATWLPHTHQETPSIPHAARDVHLGLSKRSITQLNRNTDLARNARSATSQAQTPAGDNAMGLTLPNGCPPAPPVPRGGQVPSGSCSSDSAEGRSRGETSAKPGFPRGLPSGAPALPAPGGGSPEVPGPGSCGRLCSRERHPECGRFSTFPAHAGEIPANFRSLPAEALVEAAAGAAGWGLVFLDAARLEETLCRRDVETPPGVAASPGNQKQRVKCTAVSEGRANAWVRGARASSAATTKALPACRCPERGGVRPTPALGRAGRVLSPAPVSLPCGDGRAGTQTRGGDSVRASLRTRACQVQLPSFPQVSGGLTSSTWHVRQRPQATAEMQPRTRVAPGSDPGLRKSGKRPEK